MHPKQHIRDLAEICHSKGLNYAVISPGSRSAPLIRSFYKVFGPKCVSIVDERCAAYFALGIAAFSGKPVCLICTSGTAVLNYAPAIAEAYYQKVPLLILTADRPHEWIDQQDNQTLRQHEIYRNFITASFELPQVITNEEDIWFSQRIINEAINICTGENHGPVHINVPLAEPLYEDIPEPSESIKIIERFDLNDTKVLPFELINEWRNAEKIMIIHGHDNTGFELASVFGVLSNDPRIIIIAENISNVNCPGVISTSNVLLSTQRNDNPDYPDLIIHSGGQVVSKSLTTYLRKAIKIKVWRIGADNTVIDTFKQLSVHLPYSAKPVYRNLSEISISKKYDYKSLWLKLEKKSADLIEKRMLQLQFSDVHIFRNLLKHIPANSIVALGNSSVIRYSQLFKTNTDILYLSNRGVSGIDGCLSTAAGIAYISKKLTIAIVGDLGFLYDSNALWNKELPSNLRILVVNNHGGGIFHIIKGPSEHPAFKELIVADHPVNIAKLAEAYGLIYLYAADEDSMNKLWPDFTGIHDTSVIFEIDTDASISAVVFRKLLESE